MDVCGNPETPSCSPMNAQIQPLDATLWYTSLRQRSDTSLIYSPLIRSSEIILKYGPHQRILGCNPWCSAPDSYSCSYCIPSHPPSSLCFFNATRTPRPRSYLVTAPSLCIQSANHACIHEPSRFPSQASPWATIPKGTTF